MDGFNARGVSFYKFIGEDEASLGLPNELFDLLVEPRHHILLQDNFVELIPKEASVSQILIGVLLDILQVLLRNDP